MPNFRVLSSIAYLERLKAKFSGISIRLKYPQLKPAFLCQTHLTLEERVMLYRLSLDKICIAEIGSYIGASACCFGSAAALSARNQEEATKIFCIDTWENNAMTEGEKDTFNLFRENTDSYKQFIIPLRGFSADVVEQLQSQVCSLDLLFIDGDHSYEGVKADWDAYKSLLRPGSIVVFHDIAWAEGVKRVVQENVEPLVKGSASLPNLWWGVLEQQP